MLVKTKNYRLEKKDYIRMDPKHLVVHWRIYSCGVVFTFLVDPILRGHAIRARQDAF